MTKMASKTTDNIDKLCSLCSETIQYFAVGQCDHPVCFKCSTRMRVLLEQHYCAICRSNMPKVLFMCRAHKFDSVTTHQFLHHRGAGVYFESAAVQTAFQALLEHRCTACANSGKTFRSFAALREHLRREHSRFYCELCIKHLMLFSWERRFYDRRKLAEHRRVGDADNRSHRGHPRCEFCDERYFDNDELVRHLRKDHYFCHFCDADDISNQFFGDYTVLREHFSEHHYLCEEGDCLDVQFTNAFRTDIDLAAHRAAEHSRGMRKAHAKQARTIDIDINLVPRRSANRDTRRGVVTAADYVDVTTDPHRRRHGYATSNPGDHGNWQHKNNRKGGLNAPMPTDNAGVQPVSELNRLSGTRLERGGSGVQHKSKQPQQQQGGRVRSNLDDFPELGGGGSSHNTPMSEGAQSLASTIAMASRHSVRHDRHVDDFPSLGGTAVSTVQPAQSKAWQRMTDKQKSSEPTKVESSSGQPDRTMQMLSRGPASLSSIGSSLCAPRATTEGRPVKNKGRHADTTADKAGKNCEKSAKNANVKLSNDKRSFESDTKRLKNNGSSANLCDDTFKVAKSASAQKTSAKIHNNVEKTTSNADNVLDYAVSTNIGGSNEKEKLRNHTLESNGQTSEQANDVKCNGKSEKMSDLKPVKVTEDEDWPTLSDVGCTKSATSVHGDYPAANMSSLDEAFTKVNGSKSGTKWKAAELASKPGKAYLLDDDNKDGGDVSPTVNAKTKAKRKKKLQKENVNESVVNGSDNDTVDDHDDGDDAASIVRLLANTLPDPVEPLVIKNSPAPPPGFKKIPNVKAPPPGFEAPRHFAEFIRPVDFQQRNQRLISDMRTVLTRNDDFAAFANASREFRHGGIDANTYYARCEELLGATSLKLLLPELLVLLPDIQRQGELLAAVPATRGTSRRGQRQGVSKPQPQSPFIVCHICSQVVLVGERNAHIAMHNTHADFPELGS